MSGSPLIPVKVWVSVPHLGLDDVKARIPGSTSSGTSLAARVTDCGARDPSGAMSAIWPFSFICDECAHQVRIAESRTKAINNAPITAAQAPPRTVANQRFSARALSDGTASPLSSGRMPYDPLTTSLCRKRRCRITDADCPMPHALTPKSTFALLSKTEVVLRDFQRTRFTRSQVGLVN